LWRLCPPSSPLFPYTTLFRSVSVRCGADDVLQDTCPKRSTRRGQRRPGARARPALLPETSPPGKSLLISFGSCPRAGQSAARTAGLMIIALDSPMQTNFRFSLTFERGSRYTNRYVIHLLDFRFRRERGCRAARPAQTGRLEAGLS